MVSLSTEQRAALERIAAAHRLRLTAKADAEAKARRLVTDATAEAAHVESRAVRDALALGVPKSHVMRDAIGTKDWHTIDRILALTAGEAAAEQAVLDVHTSTRVRTANAAELGAWQRKLRPGDVMLRIDWGGYQTDPDSDLAFLFAPTLDLRGFAHRDPREPGAWEVLEDDTAPDWPGREQSPLQLALDTEAPVKAAIDRVLGSGGL